MRKKGRPANSIITLAGTLKGQDKRIEYKVFYKNNQLTKEQIEQHDWEVVSEDLEITPIGEYQLRTVWIYNVAPIYPRRKEVL